MLYISYSKGCTLCEATDSSAAYGTARARRVRSACARRSHSDERSGRHGGTMESFHGTPGESPGERQMFNSSSGKLIHRAPGDFHGSTAVLRERLHFSNFRLRSAVWSRRSTVELQKHKADCHRSTVDIHQSTVVLAPEYSRFVTGVQSRVTKTVILSPEYSCVSPEHSRVQPEYSHVSPEYSRVVTGVQSCATGVQSFVTGVQSSVTGVQSFITGVQSCCTGVQ